MLFAYRIDAAQQLSLSLRMWRGRHPLILAIPRGALIEEDGQTAVFVVTETAPKKDEAKSDGKDAKAVAKSDAKADTKPDAPPGKTFSAQRRLVQVGYADNSYIEVREGLKEGDRVITVGRNGVRDGTEVQVLEAQPKAVAKGSGAGQQEAAQ